MTNLYNLLNELRNLDRDTNDDSLGIRAYRLADMIDWLSDAKNGYPSFKRNMLERVGDSFGNDNTRISIESAEAPFGYPTIEGDAWRVNVSHAYEKTFYSATSCESLEAAREGAIDLALAGAITSAQELLAVSV